MCHTWDHVWFSHCLNSLNYEATTFSNSQIQTQNPRPTFITTIKTHTVQILFNSNSVSHFSPILLFDFTFTSHNLFLFSNSTYHLLITFFFFFQFHSKILLFSLSSKIPFWNFNTTSFSFFFLCSLHHHHHPWWISLSPLSTLDDFPQFPHLGILNHPPILKHPLVLWSKFAALTFSLGGSQNRWERELQGHDGCGSFGWVHKGDFRAARVPQRLQEDVWESG